MVSERASAGRFTFRRFVRAARISLEELFEAAGNDETIVSDEVAVLGNGVQVALPSRLLRVRRPALPARLVSSQGLRSVVTEHGDLRP
jgi:hypothetical protein